MSMIDRAIETRTIPEPRGMHAGYRFGSVRPSPEADDELAWLYNRFAAAVAAPSAQGQLLAGRRPGSPEAIVSGAHAMHQARRIWEHLKKIDERHEMVLEALYTERRWPRAIEHRFRHLAGVVDALRGGFEQLVVDGHEQAVWWREQAANACAHALSAYEKVRGDGPSVAPKEDE